MQTIYQQTCFVSIHNRFFALLCLFPAFISSQVSLVVLWQSFFKFVSLSNSGHEVLVNVHGRDKLYMLVGNQIDKATGHIKISMQIR